MSIGGIPTDSWVLGVKETSLQPLLSFRVPAEAEEEETRWSNQVALSAVGDSVLALPHLVGEQPLLVRASIQLEGAMLFLVLSRGYWPFEIENRSNRHSAETSWILRPCEVRRFVFPDPEKPKTLEGRILGAGQELAVRYELDNISAGGVQRELWCPGRSKPALLATLLLRGMSRRLLLRDQEAVSTEKDKAMHEEHEDIQDQAALVNRMAFDVFFSGLHVCLADTLNQVPEELLAFTVDFIQVTKPSNERNIQLTVHHLQLDDFGDEDRPTGPESLDLAETEGFSGLPLVSLTLQGDRSSLMFDPAHGAITLKTLSLALCPVEARVDVPRLLYVASRLKGWTSSFEELGYSDAIEVLDRVLMTGFQTPSTGETTCSVAFIWPPPATSHFFRAAWRAPPAMPSRAAVSASGARKQASKFGALRPIVEFFGRLGASFADLGHLSIALPKIPFCRFSPLLITDASADVSVLKSVFARHYRQQLLQQSARVFGSLQLLGDPANLMDEIGSGVMSFFSKTKEEVLGQRSGLGSGVSDLTESIVGGTLHSLATMSGSLKDTVGSSLGQPLGSDRKASNVREGLGLGFTSIAVGLSEGITAMVKEPVKQANQDRVDDGQDGVVGLATGTAKGAASLVVRPLEGLLGAAEKLAQGAEGLVRGRFRGFCGLRRPPRVAFHPEVGHLVVDDLEK
eukprot:g3591.t1